MLAYGVHESGYRETEAFWRPFLRGLVERGLTGVQLVVSDAHAGLKADMLEREILRVVEDPADPADAGSDRAHLLAAGRDRDVGPRERVLVKRPWHTRARVDCDFRERFDHLRVDCVTGFAAGEASIVAAIDCATEQLLRVTLRPLWRHRRRGRSHSLLERCRSCLLAAHEPVREAA